MNGDSEHVSGGGPDATARPAVAEPDQTPKKEPTRFERAQKAYGLVSDVLTPGRVLLLVGVVLLLIVGLVGGWGRVSEAQDLPVVEPTATVAAAPFDISLRKARFGDELAPLVSEAEGTRYLFLSADVVSTAPEPVAASDLAEAIAIDTQGLAMLVDSPAAPLIYRLNDALPLRSLQPGVATPVVFVWRQDAAEPMPGHVNVTLREQTWRESRLRGSLEWLDGTDVAMVQLPYEELTDQ